MADETSSRLPEVRASHTDRDRTVERLREAAGDGRLTLEELDERLGKALTARTEGELAALVTDLPVEATPAAAPVAKDLVQLEVDSATLRREGGWLVPRVLEVSVDSGNVTLDLTAAVISHPTLRVVADVHSGNLIIITKPGIDVDTDEVRVSSGVVKVRRPRHNGPPPATVLRIEVVGSVDSGRLVARPPRRGFWAWLLRRPHH